MAEGKTPWPVRVVTPEGELFDSDVELLIVTGVGGRIGFYARHAPLVADLKMGETRVVEPDGTARVWATSEGFAMVHESQGSVVVEEAVPVDEIDVAEVNEWLSEARDKRAALEGGADDELYRSDAETLDKTIEWGEFLLQLSGTHAGGAATAAH